MNAVLDMALRQHRHAVPLSSISKRQLISVSYLEQMFSRLRRQGIVDGIRGPGGGYTLGRSPKDITIAQIILAVEEQAAHDARCAAKDQERDSRDAPDLWNGLSTEVLRFLNGISLWSLMLANPIDEAERDAASPNGQILPPTSAFTYGDYLARKG
ncbi:hypothetical protein GCM10007320_43400 [Pseudorhodoferax aquiterrae]|uniref:Rrf2 family transcriptional regulator n=1 Tax=Pseudorhodoferax aquiterrae TaxID=747304 RepID=A0ABQ3G662_9BURK|nr:hypothetical protein GCM10007320_43400 [Pseudorhodoferax aquiterrae]